MFRGGEFAIFPWGAFLHGGGIVGGYLHPECLAPGAVASALKFGLEGIAVGGQEGLLGDFRLFPGFPGALSQEAPGLSLGHKAGDGQALALHQGQVREVVEGA